MKNRNHTSEAALQSAQKRSKSVEVGRFKDFCRNRQICGDLLAAAQSGQRR
jgi:hypothetical protein